MLRKRLPPFGILIGVYSVIATFIYGWTLIAWLWNLPSWLFSLTLQNSLAILAYAMASCLIESLIFLLFLLVIAALTPPYLLRENFIVKGTWASIGVLGSMGIFLLAFNRFSTNALAYLWPWTVFMLALSAVLVFFSTRVKWMRTSALWISDRLTIFLILFIPASLISLVAVIIRNLL